MKRFLVGASLLAALGFAAGAEPPSWKNCPANAHAVFRADSQQLALTGAQGCATLYDLTTGKSIVLESGPNSYGVSDYSPDGKTLAAPATGFQQPRLTLYTLGPAGSLKTLKVPGGTPWTCHYSADGKSLLVGGLDGVQLVSADRAQLIRSYPSQSEVRSMALSPNGKSLAQTDGDTVRVYDIESGSLVSESRAQVVEVTSNFNNPDEPRGLLPFGHVAWSADSTVVLASSYTGPDKVFPILLLDPLTGKKVGKLETRHLSAITAVACSPDGKYIVTTSHDGELRWFDYTSKRLLDATGCLGDHKGGFVTSLVFSPDQKWLALTTEWALASIYDVSKRELRATLKD